MEGKDFQDRTRKLNKKFSGTRKQKIMQLCLKTLSGTFHWNVREKVPICPNRSCRGHRASRVRMDDGPRICGGASAGEYVQGYIACRVLSSLSQRGERWETHKRGTSFGRWATYLQIPPRLGPLHRLKGMVPEASVHVPVVMCGRFR